MNIDEVLELEFMHNCTDVDENCVYFESGRVIK